MSEKAERAVIRVEAEPRMEFPEERIAGALLSVTPRASATVAYVAPGVAQTLHVHSRPDNGDELIFIYRGRFQMRGDDWPDTIYDTDADGPVYLQIPSGAVASISNIGDNEVRFFTVFTPPFAQGELEYLE